MGGLKIKENVKIVLSVFLAFAISFSFLFYFTINFEDKLSLQKNQFYQLESIEQDKSIFLIGSSHIAQLNTTHIQKILDEKELHYSVYNLAFAGDKPEKRLLEINKIINLEPKMVIYGVGYRDFSHYPLNKDIIFLDLEEEFHKFGEKVTIGYNFPSNPKFITLSAAQTILKKTDEPKLNSELQIRPFFDNDMNLIDIKNNSKIFQDIEKSPIKKFEVREYYDNMNVIALEKILKELNNENIESILYVTPHHQFFSESIDTNTKNNFKNILEYFDENKIYNFEKKYNEKEIWADLTHIAYNKNSLEYSKDMANIIIENVDP